eukprot:GEMP01041085.1.p1 GENE.GEMP01041085.1~~GEMP01041085.1.p1  ORF type:complete len:158 (+),score=16.57 GEMP01041085.1:175-648(+)
MATYEGNSVPIAAPVAGGAPYEQPAGNSAPYGQPAHGAVYVAHPAKPMMVSNEARIEPPSEGTIFCLLCFICCFCGWLPLIPLFVTYSARKDALMYFATSNIGLGNMASTKSCRWLKYTYISVALCFILFIVVVILIAIYGPTSSSYHVYYYRRHNN